MLTSFPLQFMSAGQQAEVDQLIGSPDEVHRLHELGLRCGAMIEMVQPGVPCIIRLAGCKLCIRESENCSVLVKVGVLQ